MAQQPHNFFDECFVHLHEAVIEELAHLPTVHAALPLLRVNRYWRSLAVARLVREYSRTKLQKWDFDMKTFAPKLTLSEGAFVKLRQSTLCPQEGAHKYDDPRYIAKGQPGTDSEMILLLSHFDPKTLICTFTPARTTKGNEDDALLKMMAFRLPVNERGEEWADIAVAFTFVPTAWFRPAAQNKETIYGLELAGRPDRFPLCVRDFCPPVVGPKEIKRTKGRYDVENKQLWNGWTASWHTVRFDEKPESRGRGLDLLGGDVEVVLVVHDVKIPLIDLFCPRETSAEKDYYQDRYDDED